MRPRFDCLATAYAITALRKLGADEADRSRSIPDRARRCPLKVSPPAGRLVEMALDDGLLVRTGQAFALANGQPLPDAGELWRSLQRDCPNI